MWEAFRNHASVLEIIQVTLASVGVFFAALSLIDSAKDSVALSLSGMNGPRRIIASTNLSGEIERLLVQCMLFLIGVVSLLLPPPWPDNVLVEEALQPAITRIILVVMTVTMVIGGFRQRQARRQFTRTVAWTGEGSGPTSASMAPPPGFYESALAKTAASAAAEVAAVAAKAAAVVAETAASAATVVRDTASAATVSPAQPTAEIESLNKIDANTKAIEENTKTTDKTVQEIKENQ